MTDDPLATPPLASPDAPSERVRIEPLPGKRLDALPVLYLVGFVILAASLIYLWKHPGLPRGTAMEVARVDTLRGQINALEAKVTELSARAAPPDLGPLQARLAALEGRVAAVPAGGPIEGRIAALESRPVADLRPLEARIAAMEGKPPVDLRPMLDRLAVLDARPPVDLHPLEARIAALDAKPPVDLRPLEGRIAALEGKPPIDLKPLQDQVAAAGQKQAADLLTLGKRIDAVEAAEKATAAQMSTIAAKASLAGKLQGVSAALAAGQPLGEIPGAPPALARFATAAPPTEAGLRLGFDKAALAAHAASLPPASGDASLLDRMWSKAQQSVTVRQGDKVLVGDPIEGFIAHARQALDAGDLNGAVTSLGGLNGPAKAAMADWIGQARALLDARAAIGELASR